MAIEGYHVQPLIELTGPNAVECQYCGLDATLLVTVPIHRFQKPAYQRPYKLCEKHAEKLLGKAGLKLSEQIKVNGHVQPEGPARSV